MYAKTEGRISPKYGMTLTDQGIKNTNFIDYFNILIINTYLTDFMISH